MNYELFSHNQDMPVKWYESFDKEKIKKDIINLLNSDPGDTIELCKEPDDHRKFYDMEIVDFYEVNRKTGMPSKCVLKGDKVYYKPL